MLGLRSWGEHTHPNLDTTPTSHPLLHSSYTPALIQLISAHYYRGLNN